MRARTNIYLDPEQLQALRLLAQQRGAAVAELVREAIDAWLRGQGARVIDDDEWGRVFDELMAERRRIADEAGWSEEEVEREVLEAVREVRRAGPARRR